MLSTCPAPFIPQQDVGTHIPGLEAPYQRDGHQEGRSPEGAGPGGAGGPHKEESSSSGDQSSLGAWEGAGPEHLGIGPWGEAPVELARPPRPRAAVEMGARGQAGWSPVDAAATAAAALRAAPGERQDRHQGSPPQDKKELA